MTTLSEFIADHRKLGTTIETLAKQGKCVTREELASILKDKNTLDQHLELFETDEYYTKAMENVYCTRKAIENMTR